MSDRAITSHSEPHLFLLRSALREEREAIYRALAESLGKPDMLDDDAWCDEAEDRLAAYDRGEIPSVTLDEIAARKRL